MRRLLPLAALVAATPLAAQSRGYARPAGDTARYALTSTTSIDIMSPMGPQSLKTTLNGVVALAYGRRDSVVATFDSAAVSLASQQGAASPDVSALLHRPFVLRVNDRGEVTTLSSPSLPPELAASAGNFRALFSDFFPRLPAAVLAPGTAWTDSVSRADSAGPMSVTTTRAGSYRVARDSTVGGAHLLVVEGTAQVTTHSAGSVNGIQVSSDLKGSQQTRFLYDPARGRLTWVHRTMNVTGSYDQNGTNVPMTVQADLTLSARGR